MCFCVGPSAQFQSIEMKCNDLCILSMVRLEASPPFFLRFLATQTKNADKCLDESSRKFFFLPSHHKENKEMQKRYNRLSSVKKSSHATGASMQRLIENKNCATENQLKKEEKDQYLMKTNADSSGTNPIDSINSWKRTSVACFVFAAFCAKING